LKDKKKHLNKANNSNEKSCQVCENTFKTNGDLKSHIITDHIQRNVSQCLNCKDDSQLTNEKSCYRNCYFLDKSYIEIEPEESDDDSESETEDSDNDPNKQNIQNIQNYL
jgi:hypothetical protein